MEVEKELYADGMAQIHFAGGMVRFDFATLQPDTEGKNLPPVPGKNYRLVLPLTGFLRMFDTMRILTDRLVEKGVFRKNEVFKEKLDD